jgi:hypothetical protein
VRTEPDIMRFWWVNQNQTFAQETAGGYLWLAKRSKNGARNPAEPNSGGFGHSYV